jgi:pyrimidine deaminase RibD-like protein
MEASIREARRAQAETDTVAPKVGAALIMDNRILDVAYRGEIDPGEHAEYTLLERKLQGVDVTGGTLVTTLEPCTKRNPPKRPCADRIIERGIARVLIGTMDPNPDISGRGCLRLRDAGCEFAMFPGELMSKIEELNAEFSRHHRLDAQDSSQLIIRHGSRTLDAWHVAINKIYWQRNSYVGLSHVFSHLVEVIGGLSGLASEKEKPNVNSAEHVQKAVAWWMALCGKAGVTSVGALLYRKFPSHCPYCERQPHDEDLCRERKREDIGPNWEALRDLQEQTDPPARPSEWLRMFRSIYPVGQNEVYGPTFARLSEELGELAEAVRLFEEQPNYFLSEAADVFAWIMRIENIRETKEATPLASIGQTLDHGLAARYPDFCLDCDARPCRCPPILKRTVGRIAKEMPRSPEVSLFGSAPEIRAFFSG